MPFSSLFSFSTLGHLRLRERQRERYVVAMTTEHLNKAWYPKKGEKGLGSEKEKEYVAKEMGRTYEGREQDRRQDEPPGGQAPPWARRERVLPGRRTTDWIEALLFHSSVSRALGTCEPRPDLRGSGKGPFIPGSPTYTSRKFFLQSLLPLLVAQLGQGQGQGLGRMALCSV